MVEYFGCHSHYFMDTQTFPSVMFRFFKLLLISQLALLSGFTISLPVAGATHTKSSSRAAADSGIWNPEALEKWSHMKEGVLEQYFRLEQFIFDEQAPPWQRKVVQWILLLHGAWLLWILYMRLVLWIEKQRAWQNLDLPVGFPAYSRASRSGCSDFLFPLQNQLDRLGYNDNNLNEVKFTEKWQLDACFSTLSQLRNRSDLTGQDILLMNAIGVSANQAQQRVDTADPDLRSYFITMGILGCFLLGPLSLLLVWAFYDAHKTPIYKYKPENKNFTLNEIKPSSSQKQGEGSCLIDAILLPIILIASPVFILFASLFCFIRNYLTNR